MLAYWETAFQRLFNTVKSSCFVKHFAVYPVIKSSIIVRHSCNRASHKGVPCVNVEVDVNSFMICITLHGNMRA